MLWIKEVEMVESVDDLKSSRSIRGSRMPDFEVLDAIAGKNFQNFEMLDAAIASALNKIIQNSRFKKKVSLEEMKAHKEDRFLRGKQIRSLRPTILDYIQEFDSKWDEILLSMTQIPSDDILESLYKLRIREAEKLNTYWNCTMWMFIRRRLDLIITD